MLDSLGDRVKKSYEDRTRYYLPRRTYTVARCDGCHFHTFTKDCHRPFDDDLMSAMNSATKAVCEQVQGCQFAYIQSDEASFLLTDFDKTTTDAYFDGNIQKICSVLASTFTAWFNKRYVLQFFSGGATPATFDCRVFSIPDPIEVENYFYWRWSDWRRNFAQSVGHAHFSHKELEGLHRQEIQDKLYNELKIDLATFPEDQKHGRLCTKKTVCVDADTIRSYWEVTPAVNFKEDRSLLQNLVPRPGY